MKTLYTRLIVLIFCCTFFSFSQAQVVCINCYHQNDSISSGVTNLIQNGSFENTNCSPFGMAWNVFCPSASNYSCNLANWTCTGGGTSTYATTFDNAYCVVADGNLTAYFGNNFCEACNSSSSQDVSCLVDSACVVNGLPSGYPVSINPGYGAPRA